MTTTVADYLQASNLDDVWGWINTQADTHTGWRLLVRRAGFAHCLADTCQDLGLVTTDDVGAFVAQAAALTDQQVEGLFPRVRLTDSTPLVEATRIDFEARAQFVTTRVNAGDWADFRMDHADRQYRTLTPSAAREVAAKFPYRSAQLARSKNCEDQVLLLRGWIAQQGYLNAAIGLAGLDMFNAGTRTLAHAVPFALLDTMRFVLLDAGHMIPAATGLGSMLTGVGTVTDYRLRWLLMV